MIRNSMIAALAIAGLGLAGSAQALTSDEIRAVAAQASARSVNTANAKLDAASTAVTQSASKGEEQVAQRLAAMFKMTPDALIAEKAQLDVSWGTLANAHLLAAKAGGSTTVAQLVAMHKDGTGWGKIAAGLKLKLGQVESDARAAGKVAAGKEKPDLAVRAMSREAQAQSKLDRPESRALERSEAPAIPEVRSAGHGRGH